MQCVGTLSLLLLVIVFANAATPTQKVLELLKKLTADVVEEGKVETEQFTKYAGFCEKTIDEKKYQIGKATKAIEGLAARVESFSKDANVLYEQIGDLNATVANLENQTKALSDARDAEVASYMAQAKEMDGSISSLDRAIETLSSSSSNLEGKVGLAQVRRTATQILESAGRLSQLQITAEEVQALSDLQDQPGQAATYQYKAGDIVSMLKGLLSTFKANKQTLDMTEAQNKGTYQKTKLNLNQQLKFTKKEQSEKILKMADKNNKKTTSDRTKTETTNAMEADTAFLAALETDCKSKADFAAQRKTTREGELKALKEASQALKEGGVSLLQAGERASSLKPINKISLRSADKAPVSFVELGSSNTQRSFLKSHINRVIDLLTEKAGRIHSPVLTLAAMRVKNGGNDNFVEVRAVILDLIKRMEASGSKEADTKAFCDKEVKKHTTDRDDAMAFIETKNAFIDATDATAKKLTSEIAQLNQDIANTQAELEEATQMRNKESASNAQTIADSDAGEKGTKMAIDILKKFYSENALLQQPTTKIYSGEVVDSSGKSVSDMAPTAIAENYKGSQEKSKGVLGMLDVLNTDFARTLMETKKAEEKAQEEFDAMKEDATKELESNEGEVADKTADLTKAKEDLIKAEDERSTKKAQLEMTNDELSKLKGMCVEGDESYEARRQKRQQEIETLEESIQLINDLIKEQEEAR
eukprot:TRINITY_DN3436_c0_g2_i1.p1 TRINITY_DN3436_c0_g2~~TRINITY_DN3436_c0_g2_i1.p1  ORF type:complete len:706 (-),score=242.82 TRINITY_DN3436_c0_g2_i1:130-2247(-)